MNITPPIVITTPFHSYTVSSIETEQYFDGNLAVNAYCPDGDLAARLSVNKPEDAHLLKEGQFFLKDYSENAPLAAALIRAGIIEVTPQRVRCGMTTVGIARIK